MFRFIRPSITTEIFLMECLLLSAGFYCKFTSNKAVCLITRVYCISIALCVICSIITDTLSVPLYLGLMTSISLVKYSYCCILSVVTTENNNFIRFKDNLKTDKSICYYQNITISFTTCLILFLCDFINAVIKLSSPEYFYFFDVFKYFALTAGTKVYFVSFLIVKFELIWRYVRALRKTLVKANCVDEVSRNCKVTFNEIEEFLLHYKLLLNCKKSISLAEKVMVIIV